MKRHWETKELVDFWTLLPPEQEILANKTGATRLGFAVLLKFFALEGRFLRFSFEIPPVAVSRNAADKIQISGFSLQIIEHRNNKPADAVKVGLLLQTVVNLGEERLPRFWNFTRHN